MNATPPYKRGSRILAGVALLSSCFLLSGCHWWGPGVIKDLFGDHIDQFPTIALTADNDKAVNFPFDWDGTTVGGMLVSNFSPSKDYWRLNAFKFSDGTRITQNDRYQSMKTERKTDLNGLPVEHYVRVDLDLADNPEGTKNRKTYSFMVLFHYGD